MKYPKLTDNYSIHEINVGMSRLLNLSEQVIRNHYYTVEQISGRLSLDEPLVMNLLSILTDQKIWKYDPRNDMYFVPGELR